MLSCNVFKVLNCAKGQIHTRHSPSDCSRELKTNYSKIFFRAASLPAGSDLIYLDFIRKSSRLHRSHRGAFPLAGREARDNS